MRDAKGFNRNILVAVDDSEYAVRAVGYVGFLLGSDKNTRVLLLHVLPRAEDDFFSSESEKSHWVVTHTEKMTQRLEALRVELIRFGFTESFVFSRLIPTTEASIAAAILSEAQKGDYRTIVVGRHGLSRQEQFLFGSVSNALVNHARHCTVWVVE
ncbi:MAG: universal stress protein [Pseudomonadota bacterium]